MSEDMLITSEIHNIENIDYCMKPTLHPKNVITRFSYKISPAGQEKTTKKKIKFDKDGDYDLERKKLENVIYIEHSPSTTLQLVGLQVWRGALLLSDFILANCHLIQDKTVIELGSGTGLASLVTAMFAKTVICTDVDIGEILQLITANKVRNKDIIKGDFLVMDLNFFSNWTEEINEIMNKTDIVLAADVIYDNDLTEAFVKTIEKILKTPPQKTIYIALEKRYVFTISDLEVVAPCYEHFLSTIKNCKCVMEQLPLNFNQYFKYERVKHLVLWKITSI